MGVFVAVFLLYLFYTVLIFISGVNTALLDFFYGLLLMWLFFIVFILGGHVARQKLGSVGEVRAYEKSNVFFFCLTGFSVLGALYAAEFYTGSSFFEVLKTLSSGQSNYNNYQVYFSEASLGYFSLNKIPAILSLLVTKLSLVYVYAHVFMFGGRRKDFAIIFCLLTVTASYVYFSLARGTSFEIFEIMLLVLFCLSMGGGRSVIHFLFSKKSLILAILGFLAISIYSYNVSLRYGSREVDVCMVSAMCADGNTFIYRFSPALGALTAKLSLYFSFGLYYLTWLVESYWLSGFDSFFTLLLPGAGYLDPDLSPRFLCGKIIDCGASWAPSMEKFFYLFGIPGSFMVVFFVGYLAKKLSSGVEKKDFFSVALLYFIFLLMISLPVGNFITDSSSNLLSMIFMGGVVFFRALIVRRFL